MNKDDAREYDDPLIGIEPELSMWNPAEIWPRTFVPRVPSSQVQEPSRAAIALLAFTIVLVYLLSSSWRFPLGGDGRATLATSRSLLTHRTLAIDLQFASDEGYGPRAKSVLTGRRTARLASDFLSSRCRLSRWPWRFRD